MWKKFLIMVIGLFCTISVIYAMNLELSANATTPTLTGRISPFSKGDRVIMSTQYKNDYIRMQLLYDQAGGYPANTWFSMATKPIENAVASFTSSSWTWPCNGNCNLYRDSLLKPYITDLNNAITQFDNSIIKDRIYIANLGSGSEMQQQDPDEKKYFIPNSHVMALVEPDSSKNIIPLNANDLSFSVPYYNDQAYSSSSRTWQVFGANGEFLYIPITSTAAIRPAAYLDLNTIVFGLEPTGTSNIEASIEQPVYNSSNVHLSTGNEMKMRYLDPDLHVSLKSTNVNKVVENSDTNLEVTYGDMTVNSDLMISLLISDEDGNFLYYKNLGTSQSGDVTSAIDVSDLPIGKYTISLVNERITSQDAPTTSSSLSSVQMEIVEGHTITYTKAPQTGAELGDYEYDKNAEAGMKIGTIAYDGKGVGPIHYEIVGNGDNTYQNFEIAGLDANGKSSAASLDVKVKSSGAPDLVSSTNSLKAGRYTFCVISKDDNGDPVTDTNKTKLCVEVEVKKTQPTIAFDTQDQDTKYVLGSTSSAVDITEHATHTNQDIIAGGGNDYKITYTQDSGTSGLFTGLPQTKATGGDITISTVANQTGSIILKAHIDESDNYLATDTTKTIDVTLGLLGEYIEDKTNIKAGTSAAKPSTTIPIGHISANGGTTPYSYAFVSGENQNGSFSLGADGKLYVKSSVGSGGLTPGNYKIEVEVTDNTSPTKQKKRIEKTITVQEADLSGVAFEDPDHAGNEAGETIHRVYDPSNAGGTFQTKLIETEADSLSGTTITYLVEADPNSVIEITGTSAVSGYATVKVKKGSSTSEIGNIQLKAHVSGGKYGSTGKDISIPVNVEAYEQKITFAQGSTYNIANSAGCTAIPATKESEYWNQSADHSITYTSSDPSKATINADGELCPLEGASGTITLSAKLAGDDNYKEATATILVNIVGALGGAYIEDKTNITAGSNEAKPSTTIKIGHITATGGMSSYSYAKKAGDNDNDKFDVRPNGDVYIATTAGVNGLLPGDYTIEVEITDSTTPTAQKKTVTKTITIKPATLAAKFEDPDTSGTVIEEEIFRTYDPSTTPAGGSFHTKLLETTAGSLTGATITYSVDTNSVIEYVDMTGDYANFRVLKASDTSEIDQVKIKAHVSGGYYGSEGTDILIPVNVNKYTQEIEFTQTNPYPLSNGASCTEIPATRKSGYWNQSVTNEIRYTSSDPTKATIDASGKVCPIAGQTGTITLSAELAEDENYKHAGATIKVQLLGDLALSYQEDSPLKQAVNPDKQNDIGNAKDDTEFGKIHVSGGLDKRYDIQIATEDYAFSYFTCTPDPDDGRTSSIQLKSGISITADILKAGMDAGVVTQDETDKNQYNWDIEVLPDTGEAAQTITLHILGADPVLTFEKENNGKLTTTYAKDGTIDLSVKRGNSILSSGVSVEGSTGYQTFIGSLSGLTTDAQLNSIAVKKANTNNNDQVIAGKNIKVTPKAEAGNGYQAGSGIATDLIILKAEHPDVDFIDPDTILLSGVSSVDKGFTGIESNDDHLTITPKDPQVWEGTTFEKLDSGDATEPNVTIRPNGYEGTVVYVVNGGGTDNYKPITNKEIDLFFSASGGIQYRPIKITYGDNIKNVLDYITDEDKEHSTYTYAPLEGSSYVDADGNEILTLDSEGIITTIQAGKTKINVTRKDADDNELTQAIPVEIIPKDITLTYASSTIYTGEQLPTPAFLEPARGTFVGGDTLADFPLPSTAGHYDGNTVITNSKTIGTYDTKGEWTSAEASSINNKYKVVIKAGKLTIKKDDISDTWYHLEDQEGNTVSKEDWHNENIHIVLDTATGSAGTYDQISDKETFTNADKTKFTVTEEDEITQDVFMRIDPAGSADHKGATTNTQTTVKIDKTDPIVSEITGHPVNSDGLSELIHNLTFGVFFKPGVEVMISTEDPQPAGESGKTVSGVQNVTYKIYTLGDKGEFNSDQTPQSGEGTVDAQGNISFKINDVGNYRVCATAVDQAGNTSKENCSDLNVKKVDVDVDGDGEADFNDSDNDGCPDLNIVLGKDTEGNPPDTAGKTVKLNVAEKGKTYPYMNIDSDGDGKADLNIDTDGDQRPDLNLVILTASDWKPTKCVVVEKLKDYTQPVEYCTGTDVKPQINVDTDGDRIPNINIDNKGDFQPYINIPKDGKGEIPYLNIIQIHVWEPDKNYKKDSLLYDSIGEEIKPLTNIDSNHDGYPDINIDFEGKNVPYLNIDTDGDGIPDVNIDGNGDGVPDYNVDVNGNGTDLEHKITLEEWNPVLIKNHDGLEFGTAEIKNKDRLEDQGIVVEKPDGTFLPNFALKVDDITISAGEEIKTALSEHAEEKQIQGIYQVSMLMDGENVDVGEKVKVRIPVDKSLRNPAILIQQENGDYLPIQAEIEDGYYVFETDYLGIVAILSDVEASTNPPALEEEDPPAVLPTPDSGGSDKTPSTSVKGTYTKPGNNSIGGALTGDSTDMFGMLSLGCIALLGLSLLYRYCKDA